MKHVTYSCPHCKRVLPKNPVLPLECPFMPCPYCRKIIQIDAKERAFKRYHKLTMFKQIVYGVALSALIALMADLPIGGLVYFIRSRISDAEPTVSAGLIGYIIGFFVCLAFILVGIIRKHDVNCEVNYICWLRSNRRLMNNDYALLLKSKGFRVPRRYLNFDEKKFVNFEATAYQKILQWFSEMNVHSENDEWIIYHSKNEMDELERLKDEAMSQRRIY